MCSLRESVQTFPNKTIVDQRNPNDDRVGVYFTSFQIYIAGCFQIKVKVKHHWSI